ncbi:amidase [Garicola koreensis]|uniref:Amidase n=1 Tax=Garicola koreensis TaxID=1262554 RepID=A0A7W5TQZ9_9MICC|nr:amidase [Garicola koreensis]
MSQTGTIVALDVAELSISQMLTALDSGQLTSVDLVCAYLNRIAYYDRSGICLNSVPLTNSEALDEARASDARRRSGEVIGQLEGVPFTVKDSYMVKGMPVAAGSPALSKVIATEDAATVAQLRAAGAILLGKTNMPPMAAGGVQPGLYGYTHSPYSPEYLTAAYGSGSSYGSGTATSASFAAFGMAEETLSSGRSPASNNALVAYTPSRGLISIRGNWPLRPTCDVVVPHTRTMEDLLLVLDVIVIKDPAVRGDFWRSQESVKLPDVEDIRPSSFLEVGSDRLAGVRFGVPRLYLGQDSGSHDPPVIRDSVKVLWQQAVDDLTALGAEVVSIDPSIVSDYEEDRPAARGLQAKGYVTAEWQRAESGVLAAMALDEFLHDNDDPALNTWAEVDGTLVFPNAPDHTYTTKGRHAYDWQRLAEMVKDGLPQSYQKIPGADQSLQGLEQARKVEFEDQMAELDLDGIIFPAHGDVARADLFDRAESMEHAHQNGVVYANGNRMIRHLGVPTVTVPMGWMSDTKMPVGITFAARAYSDVELLRFAAAYEKRAHRRVAPYRTPSLPSGQVRLRQQDSALSQREVVLERLQVSAEASSVASGWRLTVAVEGIIMGDATSLSPEQVGQEFDIRVWADGMILQQTDAQAPTFFGTVFASRKRLDSGIHLVVRACHWPTGEVIGQHTLQAVL